MSAPRQVVIVGRDAPVWLSASVLQYALAPAGVEVTVVELPSQAQPADVFASLPALEALHARLGIDESRLIAATRGAFTLGRRFVDTAGVAPAFFHAHGSIGSRVDRKEFLPHWILARHQGLQASLEEFSITAMAARQGKMLVPDAEIDGFGFTDYGYHLPSIPYGAWLKQFAIRRGVKVRETRAVEAIIGEGGISELALDGGRMAGEFFLDLTADGALIGALGVARESWRDRFPADRVLSAYGELRSPVPIYSEVRSHPSGWVSLAASQVCIHVTQAFSSELVPQSAAFEATAGMPLCGVVIRDRPAGRRVQAWEKNCVALGDAACVFDPLYSLDLQAVQVGLVHLLPLFPVDAQFAVERAEYNANARSAFERMRDFQSAHYRLNRYGRMPTGESTFWRRARAAPISAELSHKIDAFRARGEVVHYEDEAFTIDDWQALLVGHGVMPESWDPAVDKTMPEVLRSEFERIQAFIHRKVEEERTHAEYLRSVCAPPGTTQRDPRFG